MKKVREKSVEDKSYILRDWDPSLRNVLTAAGRKQHHLLNQTRIVRTGNSGTYRTFDLPCDE